MIGKSLLQYQLPVQARTNHRTTVHIAAAVWHTTFADLVTLLFCFFLVLLAFAAKKESAPAPSEAINQQHSSDRVSGTFSAQSYAEGAKAYFRLTPEDLRQLTNGQSLDVVRQVKATVELGGYANKRVTIAVRSTSDERTTADDWLSSIQAMDLLYRQLIDGTHGVEVVLQLKKLADGDAAAITIEERDSKERVNHG
jgi:hypothetical protein